MPAPRTYSPNFDAVTQAADAAVAAPDGVTLQFLTSALGSMDGCRFAARSFQKSFTALRARARKLSQRDELYSNKRGPYDGLVCQLQPLADDTGWIVSLIPSRIVLSQLNIIDNATGLPLTEFGTHQDRKLALFNKAQNQRDAFTEEDWTELTRLDDATRDPDVEPWFMFEGQAWFPKPGTPAKAYAASLPQTRTPTVDLADLANMPSVFGVDGGNKGE